MKKPKLKSVIMFFLFLLTIWYLLPATFASVHAQTASFSLTPSLVEIAAGPNKEKEVVFTVKNQTDPTFFSAQVVSFKPSSNGEQYQIGQKASPPIDFFIKDPDNDSHFLLQKDQEKKITLKIQIPTQIDEGDYYYLFTIKTEPLAPIDGSVTINNQATLAAPILIKIISNTTLDSKATIIKFLPKNGLRLSFVGFNSYLLDSGSPVGVDLVVQNEGQHYIVLQGDINARDFFNKNKLYQILPQRVLAFSAKKIISYDNKANDTSLTLEPEFIGRTVVNTSLKINSTSNNLYFTITIYRVPLKLLTLFLLALSVVATAYILKSNYP